MKLIETDNVITANFDIAERKQGMYISENYLQVRRTGYSEFYVNFRSLEVF